MLTRHCKQEPRFMSGPLQILNLPRAPQRRRCPRILRPNLVPRVLYYPLGKREPGNQVTWRPFRDGDNNENDSKAVGLNKQSNNSAHAAHFLIQFLCLHCEAKLETLPDPTMATSIRRGRNRLRILTNHFAIILSRPAT